MNKSCAILISRQGIHPCNTTQWVAQTRKAIQWVQSNPFRLLTSLGQQTWEMLIFLAIQADLKQTIIIPAKDQSHFEKHKQTVLEQFYLKPKKIRFESIYGSDPKKLLYQRDARIISASDIIVPISIRKKGHMETLMNHHTRLHKEVMLMTDFQIDYQQGKSPIAYSLDKDFLSPDLFNLASHYLIHWTRTCNGPWPTERKYDYYQAVSSESAYPRNAYATLMNILSCRKIKASARHMPLKTPTVSFSGLPPHDAISLMRWRSRYCQMSFEPYGIGIDKTYAKSIGIKAVQYYLPNQKPKDIAPWMCQSIGKRSDWRLESEYRYQGDLDLATIPIEMQVCFCYRSEEAIEIQRQFGIKSIAMIS